MTQQSSPQNFSEKRRDLRYGVTGMPNATLQSSTGEEIIFFFVDASKHGLGIVVDTPIKTGEIVHLIIDDSSQHTIILEVRWITFVDLLTAPTGLNSTLYRCGLQATNSHLDLVSILSQCRNVSLEALV